MNRKVRLGLEIGAICIGVGGFAAAMYYLYLKQYAKTHTENVSVEEIPETFRMTTETVERRILPKDFEKPAIDSLIRREEQIDYSTISTQYATGERITTDTTHIIKDARGGDSVRESVETDILPSNVGDKKVLLEQADEEITEDEELEYEDEDGVMHLVKKKISNLPAGKSQAELAMRFSVINDFDYNSNGAFFEKHEVYYFPKDQIIAGMDGQLIEIDDPELLDISYTGIEIRGARQLYVRDNDAGVDYHIIEREGDYSTAYEEWVLSRSDE